MILRLVGIAIVLASLWFGVGQVRDKHRLDAQITAQKEAKTAEAKVDLSKLGKTEFAYRQSAKLSHRQGLFLEASPQFGSIDEAKRLLQGLKAEVVIHDGKGREIDRAPLVAEESSGCGAPPGLVLTTLKDFPDGEYRGTLDVTSPAPVIEGRNQTLIGRYYVCGMLDFRSMVFGILGYGAIAVSGLIATGMISRQWRTRKSTASGAEGTETLEQTQASGAGDFGQNQG